MMEPGSHSSRRKGPNVTMKKPTPCLWWCLLLGLSTCWYGQVLPMVQGRFLSSFGRHGATPTIAAIFGLGRTGDESNKIQQQQGSPQPQRLPPPPPRPYNGQQQQQQQQHSVVPPPPPPLASRENSNNNQTATTQTRLPPPPPLGRRENGQGELPPPPPQRGWGEQQQQQQPPPPFWDFSQPYINNNLPPPEVLHHDLDQALQREAGLVQELQNLSATVTQFEQREDLHLRQMDVLTERIVEIEAISANKETKLVEIQANCTALHKEMAILKGELSDYEARCADFAQRAETLESEKTDLAKQVKLAQREAESLAAMIERHRLDEKREKKLATATKKKPRGFFAWLFGFGAYAADDEEEEDWDEMRDSARSNLLQALQNERNSVEELENSVAALQSNNSAIADQVESRDAIIDELNNRIAVFEEDKVVLKAALKQLQKEIKEEAPKTAQLRKELKTAQEEIARLEKKMQALRQAHTNETSRLNRIIVNKDSLLNQSEANLTMIGSYVDKLEERLADFAVARRDINVRSKNLDDLEGKIQSLSTEKTKLQEKISSYEDEHKKLKKLMEEMASERSKLQKQNQQLGVQQNASKTELQRLHVSLQAVEKKLHSARNDTAYWEETTRNLNHQLQQKSQEYDQLLHQRSTMDNASSDMRQRIEQLEQEQKEWESKMAQTQSIRNELEQKLENALRAQTVAEEQIEVLQSNLTSTEQRRQEDADRLAEALAFRQEMEQLLLQLQSREQSFRQEAKEREESLLRKIQEQESALDESEHNRVAAKESVPARSESESSTRGLTLHKTAAKTGSDIENDEEYDEKYDESSDDEDEEEVEGEKAEMDEVTEQAKSSGSESKELIGNATAPNVASSPTHQEAPVTANDSSAEVLNDLTNSTTTVTSDKASEAVLSSQNTTQRKASSLPPSKPTKKSALRPVRKLFASATGLHGFFSGKQRSKAPPRRTRPQNATTAQRPPSGYSRPPQPGREIPLQQQRNQDRPGPQQTPKGRPDMGPPLSQQQRPSGVSQRQQHHLGAQNHPHQRRPPRNLPPQQKQQPQKGFFQRFFSTGQQNQPDGPPQQQKLNGRNPAHPGSGSRRNTDRPPPLDHQKQKGPIAEKENTARYPNQRGPPALNKYPPKPHPTNPQGAPPKRSFGAGPAPPGGRR